MQLEQDFYPFPFLLVPLCFCCPQSQKGDRSRLWSRRMKETSTMVKTDLERKVPKLNTLILCEIQLAVSSVYDHQRMDERPSIASISMQNLRSLRSTSMKNISRCLTTSSLTR
jgi:hypothetical protein